MDDTRDDPVPDGDPGPRKDEAAEPGAPEQPRWSVDAHGNLKGPIFSFPSENLVVHTDEAVTDPAELAKFRKPKPDA